MKKNVLQINNIHIAADAMEIVHGVTLEIPRGEIVALMGPNGSGKSTLVSALMGHPRFCITGGSLVLDGKDITQLPAYEKARRGLFLSPQHPPEIPGVSVFSFLRSVYNIVQKHPMSVPDFKNYIEEKAAMLGMDNAFLKRSLNEGFSGGEKKRMEMLQLSLFVPTYAFLDETDSGLDVDALKIIANSIVRIKHDMGILVITHHTHILSYLVPDKVYVMKEGKIIQEGGSELAEKIEKEGYQSI
ncbi:MAG: Fe-S cluster assembly ATPase SufC [Candidatus Ryanbacteria bacterium CG10_big_fil_rev_8_21_14_0_10_43_42]|uniref:Fe-S cluster assembly ATPase SufC n=1 Tax=Candidatus Ryanbacteria bacterium CG10_big_fil_rev_8_21_14_0_10_43_42 TaxID=1974864 RepID=A0A2M8KWN6_9BACT|nr:MAG: Fe-S cluster assembly ATPase SufC [Candidatus Ryanbacteria bacterium CG10_big_fil_rev_8_21_14_0_10_43_42]